MRRMRLAHCYQLNNIGFQFCDKHLKSPRLTMSRRFLLLSKKHYNCAESTLYQVTNKTIIVNIVAELIVYSYSLTHLSEKV